MCASRALTSVPLGRAVRRVRHHAGRLVDHQQVVVFIDDRNLDRFGRSLERLLRFTISNSSVSAGLQRPARLRGLAVDATRRALIACATRPREAPGQTRHDDVGRFPLLQRVTA